MSSEMKQTVRFGGALITSVAVAISLIFVAWAKMETVQITYQISDLVKEDDKLANDQRRLRAELAELRAPAYLENLAPQLGLAAPAAGQVVVVTENPEALSRALGGEQGQ
ncbi:MAG: hypothetical protein CMP23_14410 [Rickettsiales bacterium]|mgnify:CR=1 FL=1|nr:hypothetical protein [Rickettsiales bacterium]|tara:strand:+ start:2052 stop:2381 length:330 start_codon:yes stop_codon:yes gene_type:complete